MKKILIYVLGVIALILLILPAVTGDLETEELNTETRAQLGGSYVELSDGFTHYELKGEKNAKTILLVHGNIAPYFTWDYNLDTLVNAGFRVLRYDVYGHGYSDRPDLKVYNRDLYDRQIIELLQKLEIKDPICIVGTSQGGSISAYFAAKHPEKVEKIAFLSPLFDGFEEKNKAGLMKNKFIGDYLMNVMGDKVLTNPSKALYSDEKKEELTEKLKKEMRYKGKKRAVLANVRGDSVSDATEYYEQIKRQGIPVLLTWGENDKANSYEAMERLRKLIPEIQYHQIENASHLAHYEFSEEINPLLVNFFRTND